ncbi:MAG: radical SAM protein [Selenomonadaceae bacterium]|nr:radical SAM protein [Selenomonadaceae bacterium]
MKSPKDMRIIQIDITNACMYRCSNCTRFCGHHKKNFFMNFDTFRRAVDSMKGYHGTVGMMGGEPTLHPEFARFVEYLHEKTETRYKKGHHALIRPQRDFIESILIENKVNSEVYRYETGDRETVVGPGLWSAMVPTYKKHYELIQDVFKMQAVNDHGNKMYHSPILINRKDLGIDDNRWHEIRDNCWAQDVWSATITPKGAFFCEIAGALDMLFDGPGGWPIEEGWWKRTPDEFGDQLQWCEYCGIALETFTRDANDWIDDVSESMYKKLVEINSPKLKKQGAINLVKIKSGKIESQSKNGAFEVRKDLFYESFSSRFNNERSILFPKEFNAIIETKETKCYKTWLDRYGKLFNKIYIISSKCVEDSNGRTIYVRQDDVWGHGFSYAVSKCTDGEPIVYLTDFIEIDEQFINELGKCVLNPGTLMISKKDDGLRALFFNNASSLIRMGLDYVENADSFDKIMERWIQYKVIPFDIKEIEDLSCKRIERRKKYIIYGAGKTGEMAYKDINNMESEVIMFVDSDRNKWGKKLFEKEINKPEMILKCVGKYDKIVIASTYYQEIRKRILSLGLSEEDYIIHE